MPPELGLEGCEGKYVPHENTAVRSRMSKTFAKIFCRVAGGHIDARWQRVPIRSNPSSGTGALEREASEARTGTDQMCVSESRLRGRWRTGQGARAEAGSPSSQSSEPRGRLRPASSARTQMLLFGPFFFFFPLKSPVVPKIELV